MQAVQAVQLLCRAHVPDEHHVVAACQAGALSALTTLWAPEPAFRPPWASAFTCDGAGRGCGEGRGEGAGPVARGRGQGPQCTPALSSTLRAVGCQVTMPTLLVCPSSTTTGSVSGETNPFSGICHTCRGAGVGRGRRGGQRKSLLGPAARSLEPHLQPRPTTAPRLTMTMQSSEPLAMTSSLWGHQSMSRTGPVCPHTVG